MHDSGAQRKARGAFFTPPEIAKFISRWAVRDKTDRVLEPSAGDGEFALAAGSRLRALGAIPTAEQLHCVELHASSANEARERLRAQGFDAHFEVASFFDVRADTSFEAVVGNPPYIRYQDFTGETRRRAFEVALAQGVRLNGLASSWAAFVVHASRFLTPSGRLGLVLPAELLSVKYAAEVRRFLLRRFERVRLVLFEELVFPGVQEEVVLLLAEGEGPAPYLEVHQARALDQLNELDGAAWMPFSPGDGQKWIQALVPTDAHAVYGEIMASLDFQELREWGETYLGSVTGNNKYFTLSPEEARELGLSQSELVRIAPPGSRYLRGLTLTERSWREMGGDGKPTYMFYPSAPPSAEAERFIEAGETTGVHRAYKCRVRDPWSRVPLVPVPDLLLTYMDRDRPRLVTNRAKVRHLNSLYGVRLRKSLRRLGKDLLPIAALNSVSLLGAEMVGRAYGGGLLKLEPREADRLPMPSPALLETLASDLRSLRPQLSVALRQGRLHEATDKVDRVILTQGLGLSYSSLQSLREARELLFGRRITRSGRANGAD